MFGALRSVKIEYTTNEEVNEARQRHVAAVMDVFNVYLDMDNITVFASATVDCVLCLLKYVHGPGKFQCTHIPLGSYNLINHICLRLRNNLMYEKKQKVSFIKFSKIEMLLVQTLL